MNENFKPVLCRKCGTVVWSGISWAGFPKLLDISKLTIEEEIMKRINNVMTYEIHRTKVSFEAVERCAMRIRGSDPKKPHIVLADHQCSDYSLFSNIDSAPDYWAKPTIATSPVEGFPF